MYDAQTAFVRIQSFVKTASVSSYIQPAVLQATMLKLQSLIPAGHNCVLIADGYLSVNLSNNRS